MVAAIVTSHNDYVTAAPRRLGEPRTVGEVVFATPDGVKRHKVKQIVLGFFDDDNNELYRVKLLLRHSKRV